MIWIPVENKLPRDDDIALVTCETKKGVRSVNRAYYFNGSWHGSGSMSGVIAWAPLPKPYDGRSDLDKLEEAMKEMLHEYDKLRTVPESDLEKAREDGYGDGILFCLECVHARFMERFSAAPVAELIREANKEDRDA